MAIFRVLYGSFTRLIASAWYAVSVLLIAPALSSPNVAAVDVTIYTEGYPPYNFAAHDGTVVGVATDRVRQIMDEAKLDYDIRLIPWNRAFLLAGKEPRSLIYSLARSEDRETGFDWLAPLAMPDIHLFARADDMRVVTPEAVRAGRFFAICVETDASCNILRRAGFPEKNLIRSGSGGATESLMILYKRADLYLSDRNLYPYQNELFGQAKGDVKPVMRLKEDIRFYLAAGFQVDPQLRDRVRDAYHRLMSRGQIDVFSAEQEEQVEQ